MSQFPLFYSYTAFVFCGSAVNYFLVRHFWPERYPSSYWIYFLVTLLAEFAVLIEASDHIFKPFPPIRLLGRFLTLCICAPLVSAYIVPCLLGHPTFRATIFDLVKRASLTKAVIILILLAAARYYRLPLGKNISGLMLGFSIYLATNVANFALMEVYGPALYYRTFVFILPLSYTLSVLVWTIALWRYEPALLPVRPVLREGSRQPSVFPRL